MKFFFFFLIENSFFVIFVYRVIKIDYIQDVS